eukprot:scaffold8869_cov136-Cylindrotheca_fusiformis.AAC.3
MLVFNPVSTSKLMVAMMLTYQPQIMAGFHDHKSATSNAYGAMSLLFLTFFLSLVYLIRDALATPVVDNSARERNRHDYEGMAQRTGPSIHEYAMNLDLPPSVRPVYYS